MLEDIVIFAAGMGVRMGEITKKTPKPLINVNGKPLIFYTLDFILRAACFKRIFINSYHHASQIREYINHFLSKYKNLYNKYYNSNGFNEYIFPEIILVEEERLLETGGSVKNIANIYNLPQFIFTINSDSIFLVKKDFNIFLELNRK
ncbi:MAG TPA: NTP transferase domain-containing protein, partial [Candidatus Megaira endosymbiont of Hartmannula sinica]|nr:NTP transferase domain-containing protein [Candidatus Megaera endosymbiont of Hartmannula sinica]